MKDVLRHNALTTMVGLPLLIVIFVLAVYRPGQKVTASLRREISQAQLSIRDIPRRIAELDSLQRQLDERKRYLSLTEPLISETADQHIVLRQVSQLANSSGLSISRLEPIEPIEHSTYCALPFQISIKGDFSGIARFLYGLEILPRLFRFDEIVLKQDVAQDGTSTRADINFFVYASQADNSDYVKNNTSATTSAADTQRSGGIRQFTTPQPALKPPEGRPNSRKMADIDAKNPIQDLLDGSN